MYIVVNSAAMASFSPSVQWGSTTTRTSLSAIHLSSFQADAAARRCKNLISGARILSLSSSSCVGDPSAFRIRSGHVMCTKQPFSREMVMIPKCALTRTSPTSATRGDGTLPQGATEVDAAYMRMCVDLAMEALGKTSPNPIVGCVIVKNGRVVGRGFHPKAGEPHAEVFALREAGALAEGATAYVSLEPCNHHGRTPPCSQALVKAKLKRVVVGVVDPNPHVGGKGIKTLQSAGIEVVVGVEETLCRKTNEVFMHRIRTGQPFVTLRYSMSLDGGFLGNIGVSNAQGSLYSKLLQENDAVVITDAAVYDDPILLSSEPNSKQPLRVILARSLDLPVESKVFDTSSAKTLVLADQQACLESTQSKGANGRPMETRLQARGVDVVMMKDLTLDHVLNVCYQRGATSVLLDSRGPVFSGLENFLGQQAMDEEAAQKVVVQVEPVFLGENRTDPGFQIPHSDLLLLERVSSYMVGQDIVIEGYFPQPS